MNQTFSWYFFKTNKRNDQCISCAHYNAKSYVHYFKHIFRARIFWPRVFFKQTIRWRWINNFQLLDHKSRLVKSRSGTVFVELAPNVSESSRKYGIHINYLAQRASDDRRTWEKLNYRWLGLFTLVSSGTIIILRSLLTFKILNISMILCFFRVAEILHIHA